jgi:hypothetical protein
MMDARDLLLGQLDSLKQELGRCRRAVDSKDIDARLRARVGARLDTAITTLERRRAELERTVQADDQPPTAWRALCALQQEAVKLFEECLAFMEGALARRHGLDEGLCALTDDLLDDLAAWADVRWDRFTLLATAEFYRDTAEIIRIRYPDVSLWSLPLAVHEFGHYVGPELRRARDGGYEYPFQARLKKAQGPGGAPSKEWYHLQEYFADVFASYCLGPAYAAAFILLRSNPSDAGVETLTHPSSAARIHGILWTLDRMDARDGGDLRPGFRDVTKYLREWWAKALAAAGQAEPLGGAEEALAMQRVTELYDLLVGLAPQRLGFSREAWLRAQGAAADLTGPTTPRGLTRRDVVNAAWLARLQASPAPHAVNDVARNAKSLYETLSARRAADGPAGDA